MANRLLTRFLPFLAWWPLTPLILRADLLAGVIGALVQVPKAMAYAQLAGLPLQYGLYAAFVPAIIGALWGSSRHLATGPVAVVSLMTAAAVTPLAVPGSEDYIGLVLLLTLLVGCIQFVLGVVKLGSAVNFVSHPVILGFMNAAAIIIGLSQLDMLFGIPKGRSDFFFKDVWEMLGYLPLTHLPTLAMSVFSLALMLVVKRIPVLARPGILMVVLITTLVSALVGFEHNATGRIDEIASPRAREIVDNYSRTAGRIETLNSGLTELATRIRQAEKAENLRAVADLRYRLDLLHLDIEAAETENRNRLRVIRRMYFVRASGEGAAPALLPVLASYAAFFEQFGTPPAEKKAWWQREKKDADALRPPDDATWEVALNQLWQRAERAHQAFLESHQNRKRYVDSFDRPEAGDLAEPDPSAADMPRTRMQKAVDDFEERQNREAF